MGLESAFVLPGSCVAATKAMRLAAGAGRKASTITEGVGGVLNAIEVNV
ncbi:MAG: hypothetical protein ABI760_22370 [Ferruginibacter sp.]